MYSSVTHAEPPRALPLHDGRPSHTIDHIQSFAFPPRPALDFSRPISTRPTHSLQPSLSDTSVGPRRLDAFAGSNSIQSDQRSQGPSLPRLQDILTSGAPGSSTSGYANNWNPGPGPSISRQLNEGHHSHAGWHPPLAYPPPPQDLVHARQNGHRELPSLDITQGGRPPAPSVPLSPFPTYHEGTREYGDHRHDSLRQSSGSSYLPNGLASPYGAAAADDGQFRNSVGAPDRSVPGAYGQPAPEPARKYIGVREVHGEGTFHLYEGGFRIPTHVDGETVNPAWGLTKANKPRKRLAMACLDCREKKIKCEPGVVSCIQCEKAKRPCRKAPLQPPQDEPTVTPVWQNSTTSPGRKGASDPISMESRNGEYDAVGKRRSRDDPSPPNVPAKKHRSASPQLASEAVSSALANHARLQMSPSICDSPRKSLAWEEDPFALEPNLTSHLLGLYFDNISSTGCSIFPPRHFVKWLATQTGKSQNERLVLYAMLAAGTIFADDSLATFGRQCARIVAEALQHSIGRMNLAMAQSRLLISLYHFAQGANRCASEYTAAAINIVLYLRYNTAQGCAENNEAIETTRDEFDFSQAQLVECKRRTLWSAFLIERFIGGSTFLIQPQDIFLPLPCTQDIYERGVESTAPHFNNGITNPVESILTPASEVSPVAWLILAAAMWGDVVNFTFRNIHQTQSAYQEAYEKFYTDKNTALQGWSSRLPEHLRFSEANIKRSMEEGYCGPLISMHVLYHFTMIKLNRYVKHALIPNTVARNVRAAHRHAHSILDTVNTLRIASSEMVDQDGNGHAEFFTTPLLGYAVLAAIDVVSAGGPESNFRSVREIIEGSLWCLHAMSAYWHSARDQHKVCEKRYYEIKNITTHPQTARSGAWLSNRWGIDIPLERDFALEDDCIYGIKPESYFEIMQDGLDHATGPSSGGLRLV